MFSTRLICEGEAVLFVFFLCWVFHLLRFLLLCLPVRILGGSGVGEISVSVTFCDPTLERIAVCFRGCLAFTVKKMSDWLLCWFTVQGYVSMVVIVELG